MLPPGGPGGQLGNGQASPKKVLDDSRPTGKTLYAGVGITPLCRGGSRGIPPGRTDLTRARLAPRPPVTPAGESTLNLFLFTCQRANFVFILRRQTTCCSEFFRLLTAWGLPPLDRTNRPAKRG